MKFISVPVEELLEYAPSATTISLPSVSPGAIPGRTARWLEVLRNRIERSLHSYHCQRSGRVHAVHHDPVSKTFVEPQIRGTEGRHRAYFALDLKRLFF